MEASEARKTSTEAVTEEMTQIFDAIKTESAKGRLSVSLVSITPAASQLLKDLGYTISVFTMTNYSMISVSW